MKYRLLFILALCLPAVPALAAERDSIHAKGVHRIEVYTHDAAVRIEAGEGDWIRYEIDEVRGGVERSQDGAVLRFRSRDHHGHGGGPGHGHGHGSGDREETGPGILWIQIPESLPVRVRTHAGDVTAIGLESAVRLESHDGDLATYGGSGAMTLQTHTGRILANGTRGSLAVSSHTRDIRVRAHHGEISAVNVSAGIYLEEIRSARVEAESVSGEVHYQGDLEADGLYSFSTHTGYVSLRVPPEPDATFTFTVGPNQVDNGLMATRSLESTDDRVVFSAGNGSAQVEASTYTGYIEVKPSRR